MSAVATPLLLLSVSYASSQTLVSISVTQIYNHSASASLAVGALRQFTATGDYSDGSQQYLTQQVKWSSANVHIATVTSAMGLVKAVAPGVVNIHATLGGITGSSSLTVKTSELGSVVITPSTNWMMKVGKQLQFSATAGYVGASILDVTKTAVWSSSAQAVAIVSPTGLVTAVAAGTATITSTFGGQSAATVLTVTTTTPPKLGSWSRPYTLGMHGIHAAVLRTGKVLLWGYPLGHIVGPSPARLYDPVAGTITDLTVPWPIDIFCAGLSFLPDGRLLIDGGMDDHLYPADSGITNTTFFDPSTNLWSQGPAMTYSRWYPTTLVMPDGTVLAASGTDHDGVTIQPSLESYDPSTNSWTVLPTSADIPNPIDTYPLLIVLSDGTVFYPGPRRNSIKLDPKTDSWSAVAKRNFVARYHEGAVLLPGGQQVMIVGGASSGTDGGSGATNTTETIDFTASTPTWTYSAPMNIARYNHNLIYLADGSLLAVGGNQSLTYTSPVYQPELYNFTTGQWTLLPPQNAVRGYHSTAVLLPDGRVMSAGSDSGTPFENTYEIYTPPYLFNGAQPTITSSPSSLAHGKPFTIVTPDAANIRKVALIRPGATTHAAHMDDHRYVTLTFTFGSGRITATAPALASLAPPGYYMLVVVNANGVPSVMPFVQLQ